MACTVTLADITYGCDDLGIGGIVELHVASRAAAIAVLTSDAPTRVVSAVSGAAADVVQFSFNLKDGFSVFSEVKTSNADGTFSTVPTISAEFPKMDAARITALDQMSNGAPEMVAFVKTAAGTHHVCGLDFGLYVSTVDGNSGTGRSEKNRFQLTMTGEEAGLSYSITSALFDVATA
jgi:hypothetical protein|tara:strand:+ start:1126 stop:1659 length:534 start_codon:yes stop_codon:yes gene_type:complete